ncbi:unnamed protein product, partial [marine sediment metagenome]
RRERLIAGLTLRQLSVISGVSSSHLGRIERGEYFPSAHILRKITKPLGISGNELFTLIGYLIPQLPNIAENPSDRQLDPYVARVLSQEPVEIQHDAIRILSILRSIAKSGGEE